MWSEVKRVACSDFNMLRFPCEVNSLLVGTTVTNS